LAPSFSTELRQAIAGKNTGQVASLQPRLEEDSNAVASNRDGNTVQLESELLQMNQNTLAHALETQFISGSLSKLRMAITGRPS
jgi:flagellar basal-body rod protein FlgB